MGARKTYGEPWEAPFLELYRAAKAGSTDAAVHLMDKISVERICAPAVVVEIGGKLLQTAGLSAERKYGLYESVVLAASQLGHVAWVKKGIAVVRAKFGSSDSMRFTRLVTQILDGHSSDEKEDLTASLAQKHQKLAGSKDWLNQRRVIASSRFVEGAGPGGLESERPRGGRQALRRPRRARPHRGALAPPRDHLPRAPALQ